MEVGHYIDIQHRKAPVGCGDCKRMQAAVNDANKTGVTLKQAVDIELIPDRAGHGTRRITFGQAQEHGAEEAYREHAAAILGYETLVRTCDGGYEVYIESERIIECGAP